MKCLYKKKEYVSTKNNIQWRNIYFTEKIYYGELPEESIVTYEYNELDKLSCIILHKKSLFNRKEYKKSYIDYINIDIYPNDALLFKTSYEEVKNFSFDYLSKKLSVKEFIEYLKDNGLNVCPIKL